MLGLDKLTLVQKSSLAIGCLLSFELVLLFFLDRALQDAEADIRKESVAKAIAMETSMVQATFAESAAFLLTHRAASAHDRSYDVLCQKLSERVRSLRALLANTPDSEASLRRLDNVDRRCASLLGMLAKDGSSPGELAGVLNDASFIREQGSEILQDLEKILEQELKWLRSPDQAKDTRSLVRKSILTGAALNVVMAILLAVGFNSAVAMRLAIIKDNALRLAGKGDLLPPLEGSDEIAEVDRSFHEMASRLSQFDQLKRQFFASISHDIRAPVNSIQASLLLLAETNAYTLPEPVRQRLEGAVRGCERIVRIVTDLLDIEKIEMGELRLEMQTLELKDVLNTAHDILQGLVLQKDLKVAVEVDSLKVTGDPLWLTQAVTNILDNAIAHSPKGGKITLSGRLMPDGAAIEITDEGPGLSQEDQAIVFDRFKQSGSKKRRGSSGLGLAIAKNIVEQHGGRIDVASTPGQGATFRIWLPKVVL